MRDHLRAELTIAALTMAIQRQTRRLASSATPIAAANMPPPITAKFLKAARMIQSMSRKGNCWDNAPMDLFGYIKGYYNCQRPPALARPYLERHRPLQDVAQLIVFVFPFNLNLLQFYTRLHNPLRNARQLGDCLCILGRKLDAQIQQMRLQIHSGCKEITLTLLKEVH